MSQTLVLQLLKELKRATTNQISQLAKARYPDATLYAYVSDRLQKLQRWKLVAKDKDGFWHVMDQPS